MKPNLTPTNLFPAHAADADLSDDERFDLALAIGQAPLPRWKPSTISNGLAFTKPIIKRKANAEDNDLRMSLILPRLYVSGLLGWPTNFSGTIICVTEDKPVNEPTRALWVPVLDPNDKEARTTMAQLDIVAATIHREMTKRGNEVLVHCWVGMERSPLSTAWYLHKYRGMTLAGAYRLLMRRRPIVADRRNWVVDLPEPMRVEPIWK